MDAAVGQASTAVKVLLVCGIVASTLHFVMDRIGGALWGGYNFVSQSMSELVAAEAPTRGVAATMDLIAGLLMVAFTVGIWAVAESTGMKVLASVLMTSAILGMIATAFFPMHPGEAVSTRANTMNVVLMAVSTVALWLVAIVVAAAAFSGWFRYYSIATLAAYALLTAWGFAGPRLFAQTQRVVTTGVQERTMVYIFLLWVSLLSVYLLRAASEVATAGGGKIVPSS